jgi:hypothetical protein
MSMSGFLLDEHIPRFLQRQLQQLAPEFAVLVIGDESAPEKGTSDPDLLVWIEEQSFLLITNNRASMPVHLAGHLAQGRHVPGIVQLPRELNISRVIDDLLLIWAASLPGELQDTILYLPL